jgi:hypothetical protein
VASAVAFVVMLASVACEAQAAQSGDDRAVDKATMELLLNRINQLEARVQQLEAAQRGGAELVASKPAVAPAVQPHPAAPGVAMSVLPQMGSPAATHPASEPPQAENTIAEQMDVSKTLLRIRGFGDVSVHGDTGAGDVTTFALGQLDLFVTSDISEKFRFLSEIVFEAGPDNIYGVEVGPENDFSVDVERYLLQYSLNDYLRLSVGRGHTSIGYYNTAYHHSTWMQTTTNRPYLFQFEDRGGILPVHIVGATASGRVPSGNLGLHYVAEIGNGRESQLPYSDEPVQNVISDDARKAFNLALFARPEAVRGLQAGFSVYRDVLAPTGQPKVGETIMAAHAVLIRPKYEWLSEAVLDRHAPEGSSTVFHTPGFYVQASRQFGSYRPYFRYEYLNVPRDEPIFPGVGLRHGPIAGLRFDANESVALKLEYNYTVLRDQPAVSGVTSQIGFTF